MKVAIPGERKRLRLLIAAILLLNISGCAGFSDQSSRVVLKHPETMEFVYCEVGEWTTKEAYAEKDKCVADYEKQGYVVWGER